MSETASTASWLTKAEAAARLGVTTKTIERLAAAKKLQQAWRPQAHGPDVVVYHPADVDAIAQARRPAPAPFVLPAGSAVPANGHGAGPLVPPSSTPLVTVLAEVLQQLHDALATVAALSETRRLSETSQTFPDDPARWLTLAEAAALTNRSQAYLRTRITAGTLYAEKDRGWRIRRRDLEAL